MKNVPHLLLASLASLVLFPVLATAQSAETPNFDDLRNQWVQKLESRDLEGSLALYANDATFTNPDGTHVSGTALRSLYQQVFGAFHAKIRMIPRTRACSGSLAYEAGSYAEDLTQVGNGKRNHTSGDYLTIYRRADSGGWLIIEQVWTEARSK